MPDAAEYDTASDLIFTPFFGVIFGFFDTTL